VPSFQTGALQSLNFFLKSTTFLGSSKNPMNWYQKLLASQVSSSLYCDTESHSANRKSSNYSVRSAAQAIQVTLTEPKVLYRVLIATLGRAENPTLFVLPKHHLTEATTSWCKRLPWFFIESAKRKSKGWSESKLTMRKITNANQEQLPLRLNFCTALSSCRTSALSSSGAAVGKCCLERRALSVRGLCGYMVCTVHKKSKHFFQILQNE